MKKKVRRKRAKAKPEQQRKLATRTPGLLLAWRPPDIVCDDRAPVTSELVVGRSKTATWCIADRMLSRRHFALVPDPEREGVRVRDLESSNGTYVEGLEVTEPEYVPPNGLIRAGDCLFIVTSDLGSLTEPSGLPSTELVGRFYAAELARRLGEVVRSGRHVLIEGESGSGKLAAVKALHEMLEKTAKPNRPGKLVSLSAASFADDADARKVLFGVSADAATGTKARKGALQAAQRGTLFLDDAQRLSPEVRLLLLRFAEDGLLRREGKRQEPRKLDVRLILGSSVGANQDAEGTSTDLLTQLLRVSLSPLRDRRADIPTIFDHQLRRQLDPGTASTVMDSLDGAAMERLLLHDYRHGNERELSELVSCLEKELHRGEKAQQALATGFEQIFGPDPREGR